MKLEFIRNINDYDEHAVRLSDFNSSQAAEFRKVIEGLIALSETPVDLASCNFIQSVNCSLTLRTSEEDMGISTVDHVIFFCDLRPDTYRAMLELLDPFCRKESKGYQWLYDVDTPIGFLFSSGSDIPVEE